MLLRVDCLDLTRNWVFTILRNPVSQNAPDCLISIKSSNTALSFQSILRAGLQGSDLISESWEERPIYQILGWDSAIIVPLNAPFIFQICYFILKSNCLKLRHGVVHVYTLTIHRLSKKDI